MEEMNSITGLTGRMGGIAFISAFVAAPEGAEIAVGIVLWAQHEGVGCCRVRCRYDGWLHH